MNGTYCSVVFSGNSNPVLWISTVWQTTTLKVDQINEISPCGRPQITIYCRHPSKQLGWKLILKVGSIVIHFWKYSAPPIHVHTVYHTELIRKKQVHDSDESCTFHTFSKANPINRTVGSFYNCYLTVASVCYSIWQWELEWTVGQRGIFSRGAIKEADVWPIIVEWLKCLIESVVSLSTDTTVFSWDFGEAAMSY